MRVWRRLLIATVCLATMTIGTAAHALELLEDQSGQARQSSDELVDLFVPGELVIKLTPDASAQWHALNSHGLSDTTPFGIQSLDRLKGDLQITRIRSLGARQAPLHRHRAAPNQCHVCGSRGRMRRSGLARIADTRGGTAMILGERRITRSAAREAANIRS